MLVLLLPESLEWSHTLQRYWKFSYKALWDAKAGVLAYKGNSMAELFLRYF